MTYLKITTSKAAHLMRRYRSGYTEALFNIRHANIDVEVSERGCMTKSDDLNYFRNTDFTWKIVWLTWCTTWDQHHLWSSRLLSLFSLSVKTDVHVLHVFIHNSDVTHTHTLVVVTYLHIDEIVKWVDVLFHQPFHLQNRMNYRLGIVSVNMNKIKYWIDLTVNAGHTPTATTKSYKEAADNVTCCGLLPSRRLATVSIFPVKSQKINQFLLIWKHTEGDELSHCSNSLNINKMDS